MRRQETYRRTVHWASGSLTIRQGVEGPDHDPYGWVEYQLSRPGQDDWVLHEGLGTWYEAGSPPIRVESWKFNNPLSREIWGEENPEAIVRKIFELQLPVPIRVIQKAIERLDSQCRHCGSWLGAVEGFPGETLYVCTNDECHAINYGTFNHSVIV